ncbi:MAG: molybdopterin-guanine dinucleotide biosynthesis protein B [Proteobacteria bacterium]|nr:molybdopterin-guanine dinucleotide biosynthesis protein B [Pseudomonadota bacterium]
MNKVAVFSFVAHSGTGKTTLLEQLIPILKARGYRIGTIKHDAHRFEIDHPGKDSYRMTAAGADTTLVCSEEKLALIRRHQRAPSVEELLASYCADFDIILTEGFKQSSLPKIELHRGALGKELILRGGTTDKTLIAVASDVSLTLDVPLLDLNDPQQIADFIEAQFLTRTKSASLINVNVNKLPLISIEQALEVINDHCKPLEVTTAPLIEGLNRILAEDQVAQFDIPPHDYSAMDGYGFSYASTITEPLTIRGFLPAGKETAPHIKCGEAIRIMTGAPIPDGCNTVVPLENVVEERGLIRITTAVAVGDNIRRRGEDVMRGNLVVPAGRLVRPQEIALLSAMNRTSLPVYRKTRVAILATGDELLEPGSQREPGKIINSNSSGLAAQVLEIGGDPLLLGIAEDTLAATCAKILTGLHADLLLVTGGASVGDHDYAKSAIEELGGIILFSGVNIKPGKPLTFGIVQGKPVFALPGNPVAAMVSFELFVRPMILKSLGHQQVYRPKIKAAISEQVKNTGTRPHLVRGLVSSDKDGYHVVLTGNQSSGRLVSLTQANGLVYLAPKTTHHQGDNVEVLLLDRGFEMEAHCRWH